MPGVVQVISFKNTNLFKRGIWLTGVALLAVVLAPAAADGSLRQDSTTPVLVAGALCVCFFYFLWATKIYRLADEVLDCENHLKVRRGRVEENIHFANIAAAEVITGSGIHRISVRLREPTRLGEKIDFLPQASLWSNVSGVKRVASGLMDRARKMQHTVRD